MKILNFGSCNIDHMYSLDRIVDSGETLSAYKLEIFPGGKGLNQSVAMSRAGVKVYHAGYVGLNGNSLMDFLSENDVCTSYIQKIEDMNGHAMIQVSREGDNAIFVFHGSNEKISKEYIDWVLTQFSEGDFILLQNEINNVDYLIKKAYEMNMVIFFNPSPYNERISGIDLHRISYLILNEKEAEKITGHREVEDALAYFLSEYPNLKVMITLGKEGCVYQDKDQKIFHPIFKVDVVDTTAAGDTFTGYFVAGVATGKEYQEIIKIASCAAAITIGRNGPVTSIPYLHEVMEQIEVLPILNSDIRAENIRDSIVKYIDNHIENASLRELASILGFSVTYTGNLVRKIMGKTFSDLLQGKRLHLAKKMLLETDLPIDEIIFKVGYENGNFFRKIFRKKYGVNPLSYRKKSSKVN